MRDQHPVRLAKPSERASAVFGPSAPAYILPHLPTRLFGRDEDLRGLLELLTRNDVRLLTLTGAPGIGKTSLSFAICHAWQTDSGRPVHFVELGAISDPALLLPTIALGLNVERPRGGSLLERIAAQIGGQASLLVLDNFEQILTASSSIVDLLLRCPRLTVIVTSRSPLRVRGEYEWDVLPLRVPSRQEVNHLDSLKANPSVALLLDRSDAGRTYSALTSENAEQIAAICARLGGVPLAIELAAPWLRIFSPADMLERLNRGIDLLRGGARDVPKRQRSLSNAIDWSDNLLETHERRLFHQLAIFRYGWSLEAAEAVCHVDVDSDESGSVVDGLSGLLDKSLIYSVPTSEGSPRFSMLEIIREFALERLIQAGEYDATACRLAGFIRSFVHAAVPHLYREEQAVWLERLERELGNIRLTLRWFLDHGDRLSALQIAAELENFWLVHDHISEGQRWLEECLSIESGSHNSSEAKARRALATLLMRRGNYDRSETLHQQSLTFAQLSGDDELRAQTLLDLGSLHFIAGDIVNASAHYDRALGLGRRTGDWRTIARALNQLGEIERFRHEDAAATAHYEDSLAIWRELAERERIAMVLHNLAPVVGRLGNRQRAADLFRESLGISWELRHLHGLALCLSGIAGFSDTSRDSTMGIRLLGAADAFREMIGVRWQPVDRDEYERGLQRLSSVVKADAVIRALEEGSNLTPSDSVELATALLDGRLLVPTDPETRAGQTIPRGGLSRREYEVAEHVARGLTNREVAAILHISEKTIEMHVSNALRKLRIRSRSQLAAWLSDLSRRTESHTETHWKSPLVEPNAGENTGSSPIPLSHHNH